MEKKILSYKVYRNVARRVIAGKAKIKEQISLAWAI